MTKKNNKIKNNNSILFIFGALLLILDIILNFIYIGYKSNIVPIVVIIYAISKIKKVKIIPIILICVSSIFIIYNLTSDKYYTFKIDNKKIKIQVPTLSKLKSNKANEYVITSINPKSKNFSSYLNSLEQLSCNSNYYYNSENQITIEGYNNINNGDIIINLYNGNQCDNLKNNIKYDTYKNFIDINNVLTTDINDLIKFGYTVITDENHNIDMYNEFKKNKEAFIRIVSIENDEKIVSDITKKNNYYIIESINKTNAKKITNYVRFDSIEDINGVLCALNEEKTQKISKIF